MTNPFADFSPRHGQSPRPTGLTSEPAAGAVQEALLHGYRQCVAREAPRLAWVVDHFRLVEAYSAMRSMIDGLVFDPYDIELLADSLADGQQIPFFAPGPAGLYLSALINSTAAADIVLRMETHPTVFHFLGYRLGAGRTLTLKGNSGDFTGAGLNGGELVVQGSTGAWCGAGMLGGSIRVAGDADLHTGEWMHGGQIRVDGRIAGAGPLRYGGRILCGDVELPVPLEPRDPDLPEQDRR